MASDIEIQAREILRIRERMNALYVKYTGRSLTEIEKAMDRDTFLDPKTGDERWEPYGIYAESVELLKSC